MAGRSADQRRRSDRNGASLLLGALHNWIQPQRRRLLAKVPLGKTFQYAPSRWDALIRYVEDGWLSIDNNLAERLIRGVAVSRKNFLFLDSDRGGERAAAIYAIIESAN